MSSKATSTVMAMHRINFSDNAGNVVPNKWYQHIRFGHNADGIGILILAEIVYWYRPRIIFDEKTGSIARIEKRFHGELLQRNPRQMHEKLGFSEKQCRDAVDRLERAGYIKVETRSVNTRSGIIPRVMFIDVVPEAIRRITEYTLEDHTDFSDDVDTWDSYDPQDTTDLLSDAHMTCRSFRGDLQVTTELPTGHNTKNTTKNTTKIKEGEREIATQLAPQPAQQAFPPSFSNAGQVIAKQTGDPMMDAAVAKFNGSGRGAGFGQKHNLDDLVRNYTALGLTAQAFNGMVNAYLKERGEDELANGQSSAAHTALTEAQETMLGLCEVDKRFRSIGGVTAVFKSWAENDWRDGLPTHKQFIDHAKQIKAGQVVCPKKGKTNGTTTGAAKTSYRIAPKGYESPLIPIPADSPF